MDNQVDQGFFLPQEFTSMAASIHPWSLSTINSLSPYPFPANYREDDQVGSLFPSFPSILTVSSSTYADLRSQSVLQFAHDHGIIGGATSTDLLGLSALYMGSTTSSPFGSLHSELISKMSTQEIMDAKAQAASKSHSEAERRRRERINSHLSRLRSLLPSTTKVWNLRNRVFLWALVFF